MYTSDTNGQQQVYRNDYGSRTNPINLEGAVPAYKINTHIVPNQQPQVGPPSEQSLETAYLYAQQDYLLPNSYNVPVHSTRVETMTVRARELQAQSPERRRQTATVWNLDYNQEGEWYLVLLPVCSVLLVIERASADRAIKPVHGPN